MTAQSAARRAARGSGRPGSGQPGRRPRGRASQRLRSRKVRPATPAPQAQSGRRHEQCRLRQPFRGVFGQTVPDFPGTPVHAAGGNRRGITKIGSHPGGAKGAWQGQAVVQRSADRGVPARLPVCLATRHEHPPTAGPVRRMVALAHARKWVSSRRLNTVPVSCRGRPLTGSAPLVSRNAARRTSPCSASRPSASTKTRSGCTVWVARTAQACCFPHHPGSSGTLAAGTHGRPGRRCHARPGLWWPSSGHPAPALLALRTGSAAPPQRPPGRSGPRCGPGSRRPRLAERCPAGALGMGHRGVRSSPV
jgi:hypothetical protein